MSLLQIPELNKIRVFEPTSILRVEAQSNYCKIHFADQHQTLVVSKVLMWVQERLPPDMFVRVHRSHLVNKNYVQEITISGNIIMQNTAVASVSRRFKKQAMLSLGLQIINVNDGKTKSLDRSNILLAS